MGDHFNTSKKSHAAHCKAYLIEKGVSESAFLDFALSSNTVDDAVKIKPIVVLFKNAKLKIVTSDYHLERVKLIFNEILKTFDLEFFGVKPNLSEDAYNKLVAHEKRAIQSIIDNGLYY